MKKYKIKTFSFTSNLNPVYLYILILKRKFTLESTIYVGFYPFQILKLNCTLLKRLFIICYYFPDSI